MYESVMLLIRFVRRVLSVVCFTIFILLALIAGVVYGLNGAMEWTAILFVVSQITAYMGFALWPPKRPHAPA